MLLITEFGQDESSIWGVGRLGNCEEGESLASVAHFLNAEKYILDASAFMAGNLRRLAKLAL